MNANFRKDIRFSDFGRAECLQICPVPGALEDISLSGCRIHYEAPGSTDAGFLFLHSLDSGALQAYILQRENEEKMENFEGIIPQGDSCQFV